MPFAEWVAVMRPPDKETINKHVANMVAVSEVIPTSNGTHSGSICNEVCVVTRQCSRTMTMIKMVSFHSASLRILPVHFHLWNHSVYWMSTSEWMHL